jgi:HSP20 family protein
MYKTFLSSASELQQMIDFMDRAFGLSWSENAPRTRDIVYNLPVDIWEKNDTYYIRAAVPGVKAENVEITIQNDVLTLTGEIRHHWEGDKDVKFWRLEYTYGKFGRSIRLPDHVKTDQIEASFTDGFLTIAIPKVKQEERVVRVPVKDAASQSALGIGGEAEEVRDTRSNSQKQTATAGRS